MEQCTADEKIIQQLIIQNQELKNELKKRGIDSIINREGFLKDLVQLSILQNKGKKLSYSDHLKNMALYIFMLGGPILYEVLRANFPLPSQTTIKRNLSEAVPMTEGMFRIDEVTAEIIRNNEPVQCWISEDDTKLQPRVRYNSETDCVMGLQLPLQNGLPITNFFKFTSIREVQEYLNKYPKSSYVKLLTCRSLNFKTKPNILLLYGTSGSDNFGDVIVRWDHVFAILQKAGLECIGEFLKFNVFNNCQNQKKNGHFNEDFLINHNF